MCGIIGILGKEEAAPLLLEGLQRLAYRGYDSAGIATLVNGHIDRRRAEGKLHNLAKLLYSNPLPGTLGIGHTRWATHGRPTETNAHPHSSDEVALVHNGIIENFRELREELEGEGAVFETETDTEVVVQMVTHLIRSQMSPQDAVAATLKRLEGAFALGIIFTGRHDLMIGARRGSPLAVGYGDGEMYLGSDAMALASLTSRITYLEEGDWVILTQESATFFDENDRPVERPIVQSSVSGAMIGKGEYRHFMEKEIFEQPTVIGETVSTMINPMTREVTPPDLNVDWAKLSKLTITACGTAFYAGFVSKYWFEQIARLPTEVDIASEFRYREAPLPENGAALFVSQSGETIDTLSSLRYAKEQKQHTIGIVNVPESAIAREADGIVRTLAGPEIGVASTKAFTTQLTVLACLAIMAGQRRGVLTQQEAQTLAGALAEVTSHVAEALKLNGQIAEVAQHLAAAQDIIYLGRGTMYPLALEGALKLKEITYVHAEGFASGELKHGPIALIDDTVPVVVCAPSGPLFDKLASNVEEVVARGGRIFLVSDKAGINRLGDIAEHILPMPAVHPFVAPLVYAVPMQLLAYHAAVHKGTDVDQPRNLAKSVTVE